MSDVLLEWRGYRYFPYERDFARWEVERLFMARSREVDAGLCIPSHAFHSGAAERLTYFARAVHPSGDFLVPRQARLEATTHVKERERQATRYSSHGLHEYRGKFNPQIVGAISNILGLSEDAAVLDPFCGSGTTLLECAHLGRNALGIDRNPLAAAIANAKIRALQQANGPLAEWAEIICRKLADPASILSGSDDIPAATIERELGSSWAADITGWQYLCSWFTLPVLAQVVVIRRAIYAAVPNDPDRRIFDVVLSDCLRDASLQDPGDLRIRRRKDPERNYPLIERFVLAVRERTDRITRARAALGNVQGSQSAILGDVRSVQLAREGFDAIITSPPYETALPYVDTQRLSLVLFGHINASEIQKTEKELIGAREITTAQRRDLEAGIVVRDPELPPSVMDLARELLAASRRPENGFRRQNRPALMYRYFKGMATFFRNARPALRPGGRIALVVGTNRTVLGGREFEIDTPRLLADVAVHCGYGRVEERTMDTYHRFDLHQRNSINSETLVILSAA